MPSLTPVFRIGARRPRIPRRKLLPLVAGTLCVAWFSSVQAPVARGSEHRVTQVVRAVQTARRSVVNIQGQKTILGESAVGPTNASREVSGMGTGVVIDPRGYMLTNHHVVAGVRRINVTMDGGRKLVAHLVAHDEATDLAVIKVRAPEALSVITVGTSSDLMTGEPVIALGNAYGYEHTVTRGIISALHRDVQVTDTQSYDDLIQTDASINPGNSGGPLLNIDGEMIGINVAVRAGAQGIGFAIPVDKAMEVASRLLSVSRLEKRWHGVESQAPSRPGAPLIVRRVQAESPAADSGLQPGDYIRSVASIPVTRPLDLERALLGRQGTPVDLEILRGEDTMVVKLATAPLPNTVDQVHAVVSDVSSDRSTDDPRTWDVLGMELAEEPDELLSGGTRYRGGMRVVSVRDHGPAAEQGIRPGDILVGMHKWETASQRDIDYIVRRANMGGLGTVKFYVVRGGDTLFGHMQVASLAARRSATIR